MTWHHRHDRMGLALMVIAIAAGWVFGKCGAGRAASGFGGLVVAAIVFLTYASIIALRRKRTGASTGPTAASRKKP